MELALIIVSILFVGTAVATGFLYASRKSIAEDRDKLEQINEAHLQKLDAQGSDISDLKSQMARAEERETAARHEAAKALEQAKETFKALAGDTLKDSQDQFIKQANEKFAPFSKTLDDYKKLLRDIEEKRSKAYAQITEQVGALHEGQQTLRSETANLVRALRRPEGRGSWGELQMERLFELAGMTERVDFDAQASVDARDGGKLRPDFTVRLPNERVIVVDVKTPMDAYLDAIEANDDAERDRLFDRHARNVKEMAASLSRKEYWEAVSGSPEFVVMFIPGESMLHAAVQREPDLIERAMEQNVILATPTLMMALLKTVALGWQEQSISENAKQISEAGRELYDRIRVMFSHLSNLHKAIGKTNEHYNKLVGSLERNVLPQARRMDELGAAGSKKTPDALPEVEINPRLLDVPEAAGTDD